MMIFLSSLSHKRTHLSWLSVLVFLICLITPRSGRCNPDLEFLVDFSASMRTFDGRHSRVENVRSAVKSALKEYQGKGRLALRVYGHRFKAQEKSKSCHDSELVLKFGEADAHKIEWALSELHPRGFTPLTYSLEQLKSDFKDSRAEEKIVILISDGKETCGGDPVSVMQNLREEGFDIRLYAVGISADKETKRQLEAIAAVAEGKYYDVTSPDQLQFVLKSVTEPFLSEQSGSGDLGLSNDAGASLEQALPIQAINYPSNSLGGEDAKDVFVLMGKSGQKYFASVDLDRESAAELEVTVLDGDGNIVANPVKTINGAADTDIFVIRDDGQYYLSIKVLGQSPVFNYSFTVTKQVG